MLATILAGLLAAAAIDSLAPPPDSLGSGGSVMSATDTASLVPITVPSTSIAPAPPLWTIGETFLAIGFVAGTVGLMPLDEDAQTWASKRHSATSRGWAAASKAIGDGYVTIPATGLLWALGEWNEQPRLARASRNGLEAWCLTELFVQSAKYGFHRWRPSESASSQKWGGPGIGSEHLSFPSGHSASAWGLLPAFALEYSDTWWVPTLAYGLSASTSLSRIHDGQHWMSDVFFSAGVGVLSNRIVRRWNARNTHAVAIIPLWGNGLQGVAIASGF